MLFPIAHFQSRVFVQGQKLTLILFKTEYTFNIESDGTIFSWQQIAGVTLAINNPNLKNPTITRPLTINGPFVFEVTINHRVKAQFMIVTSPVSELMLTLGGSFGADYQKEWGTEGLQYAVNEPDSAVFMVAGNYLNQYFYPPQRHANNVTSYEIFLRGLNGDLSLIKTLMPTEDRIWLAEVGRHYIVRTHLSVNTRLHVVDSELFYVGIKGDNAQGVVTNSKIGVSIAGTLGQEVNWSRSVYLITQVFPEAPELAITMQIGGTGDFNDINWTRNVYVIRTINTESNTDTASMTLGGIGDFSNIAWSRTDYSGTTT